MRFASMITAVAILLGGRLSAEEPEPIELTLHPRAIETPVLKYRLFPAEAELMPGNAAVILLRLPWDQTPWMTNIYPTLHEWESRPLTAPEWKSAANVLPGYFYSDMKRAAYRREAHWEYPIRETQVPYAIRVPDLQGMRGFLRHGLSIRIRYHLSRGELDKAREGITVGLANARHLAQTPFYIAQLVALTIHRAMLERTVELIAQPGSPNLYWALSTLPDSLVEFGRAASLEASLFAMTLPAVQDFDRPRDAREWSRMSSQLIELLQELGEIPEPEAPAGDAPLIERLLDRLKPPEKSHFEKLAGQARAELPDLLGVPAERVAAMSDNEAAIRWYVHLRMARDHRAAALMALPPREAWPQLKELREDIRSLQERVGTLKRSFDAFDPVSIYISAWSLKRRIQALRIIEAVRHYLATHDGRLPATLADIKDLPVPLDPLTDRPFEWKVDGEMATLKAPPLPADVVEPDSDLARSHALEYRLRVRGVR